ncbi:MAG: TIGR03905 family TSCPD domain-containing protein [Eubacteriales bacterium]
MTKTFTYKTKNVCSRSISFDLDGDTIKNVRFDGGCHGNTQGLASLAEGMSAKELVARLRGTDCRGRGTSCPDQLAIAVEQALAENK